MKQLPDTTQVFDFDVGCLRKSPCRDCFRKDALPECAASCELLKQIQSVLSSSVSCTRTQMFYSIHIPISGNAPGLD